MDWCSAHLAGACRAHDEYPEFTHIIEGLTAVDQIICYLTID